MSDKLVNLYNALSTVETKGGSTKTMADCLRYLEQLIKESKQEVEVAQ